MGILNDNIKVRIPVTLETFQTQHDKLIKMGFKYREPYIYYTKEYKTGPVEKKVILIVSMSGLTFRYINSDNTEATRNTMPHKNDLNYLMAIVDVNDDNLSRCERKYLEWAAYERELQMYQDMSIFEKLRKLFKR